MIYILATVPYLMPWTDFRFLSWCHLIGSLAPWCGSFLYHLFMNLDRGEVVYYRLLKLDMFGIWMSQSFGNYKSYFFLFYNFVVCNVHIPSIDIHTGAAILYWFYKLNDGCVIAGAVTFVTATGFCWKIKSILILGYCVLCLYGLYKVKLLLMVLTDKII